MRFPIPFALVLCAACQSPIEAPVVCAAGVQTCTSDAQCGGTFCVAGCCTGVRTCTEDADCPGQKCLGGRCGDGRCASASDCSAIPDLPVCDNGPGGSFACVQCVTGSDCSSDGTRTCEAKVCVAVPGGCASNADCRATLHYCNRPAHVCVACLEDRHCIEGQICDANTCKAPNGPCTSDTACRAPTPVCDAASHACVPCVDDTACGPGRRCQSHACVDAGCTSDAHCAANPGSPRCDTAISRCVPCLAAADCEAGFACQSDHSCSATGPCDIDATCRARDAARPFCLADGRCVACKADADCGDATRRCLANACVARPAGCTSDTDCRTVPTAPRCAPDGACVACLADPDCGTGRRCEARGCLDGCRADASCAAPTGKCLVVSGTCVACLADGDCGTGRICRGNACEPGCRSGADCVSSPAGRVCNVAARACVACLANSDCAAGAVCVDRQCVAPQSGAEGLPCGAGGACNAGLVCHTEGDRGICRATCDPYASTSGCASGRVCARDGFDTSGASPVLRGVCAAASSRGPAGAACTGAADCENDLVCIPTGAQSGLCSRLCNPDGGTCPGSAVCRELPAAATDDGELLSVGGCVPAASRYGTECASDYTADGSGGVRPDCGAAMTCGPVPLLDDSTTRVSICRPRAGTGEADQACTTGDACTAGACLAGPRVCNTSCRFASDCSRWSQTAYNRGYRCLPYFWTEPAPPGEGELAATSITGACMPTCKSDASCPADRFCMLTPPFENSGRFQATFYSYCFLRLGSPSGPQKGAGQRCAADGECRSGWCRSGAAGSDGYCFGSCDASAAASAPQCDAAAGSVCDPSGVGLYMNPGADAQEGTADDAWGRAFVCSGRRCSADSDCAGLSADASRPRACALVLQVDGSNSAWGAGVSLRTACEPAGGTARAGAACTSDADCASGNCLAFDTGHKGCFGACRTQADCASGSTCANLDFGTAATPNVIRSCKRTR